MRPLYCLRFPLWDGADAAMAASERLQLNVIYPSERPPPRPDHAALRDVSIVIAHLVATPARPGQEGGHCRRNLRVLSTEEMAQKNVWSPPQKIIRR